MPERARLETAGALAALLVCLAFVASFALGLGRPGSADPLRTAPDPAAAPMQPPAAGRIEVLNGSGRSGMARAVTGRLRDAGYDVVYFGNAPAGAGDSSVVFARSTDDGIARAVGASLGIARVISRPDASLLLDATVVLGRDFSPAPDGR
jgi:hypothetical protein